MKKPWKLCLLLKKPTKSNKLQKTKTCIIVLIKTATYSRKKKRSTVVLSKHFLLRLACSKSVYNKWNKTLPAIFQLCSTQKLQNKLQETHAKLCDVYFRFYPRGIYGTCHSTAKACYLKWNATLLKSSKSIMAVGHQTHCDLRHSKTALMPGSGCPVWLFWVWALHAFSLW